MERRALVDLGDDILRVGIEPAQAQRLLHYDVLVEPEREHRSAVLRLAREHQSGHPAAVRRDEAVEVAALDDRADALVVRHGGLGELHVLL